jgi:GTP-binding protein EngB required for normal cell division
MLKDNSDGCSINTSFLRTPTPTDLECATHDAEDITGGKSILAGRSRRHSDQVIFLLAGHSGHGKSRTINRLIGQDLLPMGRTTLGSTTKVYQFSTNPYADPNR